MLTPCQNGCGRSATGTRYVGTEIAWLCGGCMSDQDFHEENDLDYDFMEVSV